MLAIAIGLRTVHLPLVCTSFSSFEDLPKVETIPLPLEIIDSKSTPCRLSNNFLAWHTFSYSSSITPIDKRGVVVELQESLSKLVKEQNIDLPSGDY